MDGFNDTVAFDRKRIEEVHTNLARADEELVFDLVAKLAKRSRAVLHLDDLTVHTIDRAGNSTEDHINEKEVMSGDATAWFKVADPKYGETEKRFEIQYGVYAGSNPDGGFVYDQIEVEVRFKD